MIVDISHKANFNPRTLQESATSSPTSTLSMTVAFQSTHPTRECDEIFFSQYSRFLYFNPRTLQESATVLPRYCPCSTIISIHAPYKRVRHFTVSQPRGFSYFNPRTLQESATWAIAQDLVSLLFQSTHPTRECDRNI